MRKGGFIQNNLNNEFFTAPPEMRLLASSGVQALTNDHSVHMTRIYHFSHALVPYVRIFVQRSRSANPTWNSNHGFDHTTKVDIQFLQVCSIRCHWRHNRIQKFIFLLGENISVSTTSFVAKKQLYNVQLVNDSLCSEFCPPMRAFPYCAE